MKIPANLKALITFCDCVLNATGLYWVSAPGPFQIGHFGLIVGFSNMINPLPQG